jgi:serine/threonine-protein kinase
MRQRGKLAPAELARIVAGTCAGLAAAHGKNIVHRDLKPDNIFLVRLPDGGEQVKLLDFGIAKVANEKKLTQTGEILGTPRYMAPEQLAAEHDLDGRTDVYALGVILFEALAGKPPYLSTNPTDLIVSILHGKHAPLRSYRPDVTPEIEAVVARAMARAREARYATAVELGDAFVSAALGSATPNRAGPRAGMETAFMGSLADDASAGDKDAALRPGTFSELEQSKLPPEARADTSSPAGTSPKKDELAPGATAPAKPMVSAGAGAQNATVPARISAVPSVSNAAAVPRAPTRSAGSDPGQPTPEGGRMSRPDAVNVAMMPAVTPAVASATTTEDYRLPTTGGRTKLVVIGMLAGGLSAGLAILGLGLAMRSGREDHAAPAAVTVDHAAPTAPLGGEADDAGLPRDAGTTVTGDERPPATTTDTEARTEPARTSTGRREADRNRDRSRGSDAVAMEREDADRGPPPPPTEEAASPPAREPSARELVDQARAALRAGDARRCVDLCDAAVRAGAGPDAIRLRGDCLLGVGDRSRALESYERFCRAAPTHPSIGEVRAIVQGMGGTCN